MRPLKSRAHLISAGFSKSLRIAVSRTVGFAAFAGAGLLGAVVVLEEGLVFWAKICAAAYG